MRLLAFACALVVGAASQGQSPRFDTINAEDGLPGFSVWDVQRDSKGYLWLATVAGLVKFDNFKLSVVAQDAPWSDELVRTLFLDASGTLWIGTDSAGLLASIDGESFHRFRHDETDVGTLSADRILAIAGDESGALWIGTSRGLDRLDPGTGAIQRFAAHASDSTGLPRGSVRSLASSRSGHLWIGTYEGLARLDPATATVRRVKLQGGPHQIVSLKEDPFGQLWIGTRSGLLRYNPRTQILDTPIAALIGTAVVSIESSSHGMWFGTIGQGLFIRSQSGEVTSYSSHPGRNSLADDVVISLFAEPGGTLWAGTFNNGVSRLDTHTLAFGRYDNLTGITQCMSSAVVYSLFPGRNRTLWIGSDAGVGRIDRSTGDCTWYAADPDDPTAFGRNVLSFVRTQAGQLYATSSSGLGRVDEATGRITRIAPEKINYLTYFAVEWRPDELILGGEQGLHLVSLTDNSVRDLSAQSAALSNAAFRSTSVGASGVLWLATSNGLAHLTREGSLDLLRRNGRPVSNDSIGTIHVDANGRIWAGLDSSGLSVFRDDGELLRHYSKQDGIRAGVAAIRHDSSGSLWVSTLGGLIRITSTGDVDRAYLVADGLQGNSFSRGAAFAADTGELFFGGRRGFNAFFPQDIVANPTAPIVAFTQLRVQNAVALPGQPVAGFTLPEPIDRVTALDFDHRHRMLAIELTALDTAQANRARFAYKLDGFDPDWNLMTAPERVATYTNLPSGRYVFRAKAANPDGIWSDGEKTLDINIAPPYWETWWARSVFVLTLVTLLGAILVRRSAVQTRQRLQLEQQVALRTREVKQQKQAIEEILKRKNALFENISHEFRTPLTLLIGPMERLRKKLRGDAVEQLDLAVKNAKRLLIMVDQLLRLAEVSQEKPLDATPRQVGPVMHMLAASFAPSARQKHIEIEIGTIPDVSVLSSHDAMEIVVGNLLSNAIKYSNEGGSIEIRVEASDENVEIHVIDDGPGISRDDRAVVFDRFVRLARHEGQAGTGLGLAVAREVVEANGGSVDCRQPAERGAHFVATFMRCEQSGTTSDSLSEDVGRLTQADETKAGEATGIKGLDESDAFDAYEDKKTILVIDDNADIHDYLASVLAPKFVTLRADNGKEGLEIALSEVPDLIVCDVMMPEMDGYEVSRELRNSNTCSHIPIVLLTARGDRDSRMRGWAECVDDYVKKPFDEEELVSRIERLLRVRDMLGAKRGESISEGDANFDTKGLTLRDQHFLKKLESIVGKNYGRREFGRPEIAKHLAVSERQLQRKMKALINRNPSTYLKDYRLLRARDRLVQGHEISQVAYDCGFSTASYFSKCFREKYGAPPKRYLSQAGRK